MITAELRCPHCNEWYELSVRDTDPIGLPILEKCWSGCNKDYIYIINPDKTVTTKKNSNLRIEK